MRIENIEKFLSIPFEKCNCFDLVSLIYKKNGIDIGNYTDRNFHQQWEKVTTPIRLDLIYMDSVRQHRDHVGVYIGNDKFIHAMENRGSEIASLNLWKKRIKGIYRWRK